MKIPLQQLTLYSSMKLFLAIKEIPVSWIHPLNTFSSQHTMSRGRPLKVLISETYRGPSGNCQVTNTKTDDLMKKLSFIDNSPCITCLFLFYTRRTNNQKFQAGTSTGHLLEPVAERPGDQMMGRSRDVFETSVKHAFWIQLTNALNLLWQVTQWRFIVNGSSERLGKRYGG